MTPSCMHSVVRRRSSGGGVLEQRRFLLSLHVCVCVFEDNNTKTQARLCETYQRESWRIYGIKQKKEKKKNKVENERARKRKREESFGIKWKVKTKKKGEDGILWVCVWWTKCKRKKRWGNVWMKEMQRIRNHNLKILPNIFTINFK